MKGVALRVNGILYLSSFSASWSGVACLVGNHSGMCRISHHYHFYRVHNVSWILNYSAGGIASCDY